jgi:hypothetical protein
MADHISQLESELQNIPEAAPKASPSFSVSEKLARYGSSALSGVEHLTLLVGKESVALALIRHFGSLKALTRASFQELRQFLPRPKAEAVIAALSMSAIAEIEHARSEKLDNPESIYRACADMKLFNQEVLRVISLDTRYRHISTVEITKGSINESLAHPRGSFGPISDNRLMLSCSCTTILPVLCRMSFYAAPPARIGGHRAVACGIILAALSKRLEEGQ